MIKTVQKVLTMEDHGIFTSAQALTTERYTGVVLGLSVTHGTLGNCTIAVSTDNPDTDTQRQIWAKTSALDFPHVPLADQGIDTAGADIAAVYASNVINDERLLINILGAAGTAGQTIEVDVIMDINPLATR